MKRLFALIGFSYLITLTAAMFLPLNIIFIILLILIFLFIISMLLKNIRKDKGIPITLATIVVALSAYALNMKLNVMPIQELVDKDITVSGVICDLPYKSNGRYNYTLEIDNIVGYENIKNFRINLSTSDAIDADVYDRFTGNIHTFLIDNDFYYSKYSLSKKIYLSAFLYDYEFNSVEKVNNKKSPYYYALKFREKMLSVTRFVLPERQASVANGILLGDKHSIPGDIKKDFLDVEVYHLLTVSGIHVSIVSQILIFILKRLKINQKISSLISIAVIFGFMAITGFTPSVMRAGIMSIIYTIGVIIGRNSDSLNSLGFAVLVLSLFNPNVGGDIRLWLSALSVLGIITFARPIEIKLKDYFSKYFKSNKLSNYILKSISVTLSVTLASMPVNVIFFRNISLISPIANILMMFPISIMIFCTIALDIGVILCLPKIMIMPFGFISGVIINYLTICARVLSKINFASISIDYPFVILWVSLTLILISICVLFGKTRKYSKLLTFISADLLLLGIISYQFTMLNVTRVSVVDSGNGSSVVLKKNGHTAIISCGGELKCSNSVTNYLSNTNTRNLDFILVPSEAEECSMFFSDIESQYNVNTVILPVSTTLGNSLSERNVAVKAVRFKDKINSSIWGNVETSVFKYDEFVWVYLTVQDVSLLICPTGGDIDKLPAKYRNCDIFIAGELPMNYNRLNPLNTVISMNSQSCKVNVPKLLKYGMNTCATSDYGAVHIDISDSNRVSIRREI